MNRPRKKREDEGRRPSATQTRGGKVEKDREGA
jgi:hypothetical protein